MSLVTFLYQTFKKQNQKEFFASETNFKTIRLHWCNLAMSRCLKELSRDLFSAQISPFISGCYIAIDSTGYWGLIHHILGIFKLKLQLSPSAISATCLKPSPAYDETNTVVRYRHDFIAPIKHMMGPVCRDSWGCWNPLFQVILSKWLFPIHFYRKNIFLKWNRTQ